MVAGADFAGVAFLAAGLVGAFAAADFFSAVALVATVFVAATFFAAAVGVVARELLGDAVEEATELEVAFLVVSGFLRNRSTKPPSPLRADATGAGDAAPFELAEDLFAGAGFDVAMCDLVQCSEGSSKTLVKSSRKTQRNKTGPYTIMARLLSQAVQAQRTERQRESTSPAVSAA